MLQNLPRQSFGFLPTPIHELPRLSEYLGGPRILIKRDDQTGLALGGNKTRKLEFLIAEALVQGCDTVITAGAAQSNHCRQTAAAAAQVGLGCHLALGGFSPVTSRGNLLLAKLLGAHVHWTGNQRKGESIPAVAENLRSQGSRPYIIPYGGSNATGALGFVVAASEVKCQLEQLGETLDAIVLASSSGGTQAGLTLGKQMFDLQATVVGIGIDKEESGGQSFETQLADLATATAAKLEVEAVYSPQDFVLNDQYLGSGYGMVGDLEREAIALMAQTEGILLDPVYSGRAMGGLLDMIRSREFKAGQTLLFWHTGGTPALFAYAETLTSTSD